MRKNNQINWIFVVISTLVLLSFIILPPLFRLYDKKQDDANSNNSVISDNQYFVCVKETNSTTTDIASIVDEIKVYGKDNIVNIVARRLENNFSGIIDATNDAYELKKNTANNIGEIYYNYSILDSSIIEEYRITYSESLDYYAITDMYINKDINIMLKHYTDNGYICE